MSLYVSYLWSVFTVEKVVSLSSSMMIYVKGREKRKKCGVLKRRVFIPGQVD